MAPASSRWTTRRIAVEIAFRVILALFIVVAVSKVHEPFPALSHLSLAKILGAGLVVTAYAALDRRAIRAVLKTSTARWIAVIVILAVLSIPLGLWATASARFVVNDFWKTVLVFIVIGAAAVERRRMKVAVAAFVGGAVFTMFRVLAGWPSVEEGARFAAGGTFDANETALLFLVAIPFVLNLASRAGRLRPLWYATALTMVAAIIATGSRGGFIGLMALALWVIYRTARGRRVRVALAVIVAASVFIITMDEGSRERFDSLLALKEDYNITHREGRLEVWKRGVGYMFSRPLLGVGVANFPTAEGMLSGKKNVGYGIKYSSAHNSFLQIGTELGLLGLVAFIGMLWTAASGCRRVKRRAHHRSARRAAASAELIGIATAIEGALLALVVTSMFLSYAYQIITYFLVALAVGIRIASSYAEPSPLSGHGRSHRPGQVMRPTRRTVSAIPVQR